MSALPVFVSKRQILRNTIRLSAAMGDLRAAVIVATGRLEEVVTAQFDHRTKEQAQPWPWRP